ncbi:MAG TPA: zinc-ribbon domain-containing protein [Trebonia sp.]|nr:zinc-ribbon domain-containing protein [Trebonia sp.]
MIIIWGLRVVWSTIATGVFYCRKCGGDRNYRHRSGRRFFTLFWIPIIPMNKVGEHVMCETCKTRYVTEVLQQRTVAAMQAAVTNGTRAMVVVMLQSGDATSAAARAKAVQIAAGQGAAGYNDAALAQDLATPGASWLPAIKAFGEQLQPDAKEWHLAEMVRLARIDGPLTETERASLAGIAADLGMTPAQALGVITLTEQAPSGDQGA